MGEIFGDEVMAAALIDRRLLHHCHIINIRGNSFRRSRLVPVNAVTSQTSPEAIQHFLLRIFVEPTEAS